MSRRLKHAALLVGVSLAAAQLIRPDRRNPVIDASRTIQAHVDANSALPDIFARSCGNCHSNATVWPRSSNVAPVSWLVARVVADGRKAVNFSDWAAYQPDAQRTLLAASCEDVRVGKMPGGAYTLLYPEARLSVQDIETICAAAR